jgi:hypothetical protein
MKKESAFQSEVFRDISERFPEADIIKNDSSCIQGFPDLTIFFKDKFVLLELKRESKSSRQPNQEYYIKKYGKHKSGYFVYPENKNEILNDLERRFKRGDI